MVEKISDMQSKYFIEIESELQSGDTRLLKGIVKKKKQKIITDKTNEMAHVLLAHAPLIDKNFSISGGGFKINETDIDQKAVRIPREGGPDNDKRQLTTMTARGMASLLPSGSLTGMKPHLTPVNHADLQKKSVVASTKEGTVQKLAAEHGLIFRDPASTVDQHTSVDLGLQETKREKDHLVKSDMTESRLPMFPFSGQREMDVSQPLNRQLLKEKNVRTATSRLQQYVVTVPETKASAMEFSYRFRSWSDGQHSVNIKAPGNGKITLLPSGPRAADALSRELPHLSGITPELLQSRQEHEEQQRRQQQEMEDEE